MKYAKLKEDWTVILELVRLHKERMAALLVAKKASKTSFSSVGVSADMYAFALEVILALKSNIVLSKTMISIKMTLA